MVDIPEYGGKLSDEIADVLTIIFQNSLETGIVPKDWRVANVNSCSKKGKGISQIPMDQLSSHQYTVSDHIEGTLQKGQFVKGI